MKASIRHWPNACVPGLRHSESIRSSRLNNHQSC
jgi:hypothetical protein